MSSPVKHHYVPRLYLKHFEVKQPDGTMGFHCYNKSVPEWTKVRPSKASCYSKHFYTVLNPQGEPDNETFEKVLKDCEDIVAPILAEWVERLPGSRWQAPAEQYTNMIGFLALQYLRVPKSLEIAEKCATLALQALAENGLRKEIQNQRLAQLELEQLTGALEAVVNGNLKFIVKEKYKSTVSALSLLVLGELTQGLLDKACTFFTCPPGKQFFTCDFPVVPFLVTKRGFGLGPGPLLPETHIWFPLSPAVGMHLYPSSQDDVDGFPSPEETVDILNSLLVASAQRTVISSVHDPEIHAWLKQLSAVDTSEC